MIKAINKNKFLADLAKLRQNPLEYKKALQHDDFRTVLEAEETILKTKIAWWDGQIEASIRSGDMKEPHVKERVPKLYQDFKKETCLHEKAGIYEDILRLFRSQKGW